MRLYSKSQLKYLTEFRSVSYPKGRLGKVLNDKLILTESDSFGGT